MNAGSLFKEETDTLILAFYEVIIDAEFLEYVCHRLSMNKLVGSDWHSSEVILEFW